MEELVSERHVPPLTPKKVAQLGRFDHHGFAQDWVLQQGTIAYPVQPPHLSPMSHSQAALTFSPSRHANFTGTPEPPSRDAALIIHVDNTAGKTAKKPASSAGGRGAVGKAEEKKRNRRLAAAMRKRNTSSLQEPGSDPAAHRLVRDLPNARELSSPLLRPRGQLDKDGKGQIQARDKANHDPHQRDAPRTAARKPSGSKEQGSRRQYRSGRSQLIELEDDKAAAAKRAEERKNRRREKALIVQDKSKDVSARLKARTEAERRNDPSDTAEAEKKLAKSAEQRRSEKKDADIKRAKRGRKGLEDAARIMYQFESTKISKGRITAPQKIGVFKKGVASVRTMTTKSSKDKGKGKGKGAGDLAFSELRFLNGPRPRAESGSDEDGTQNESESQDRHESVEGSVQDRTSKFFKSDTAKSRKKLGGGPSGRVHQGSASCGSHKSNESTARKRKGSRRQSTRKSEVKSREARASSTYDDASSHSSDDQAHSAYSNQQRARHQRAATSHRAREPSSKDSRTKTKKRSCRSANSNSEDEAKNHEQAAQRRRGTSPEANAEDLSDWSQSTVAVVIDATKARWNKSNQKKTRRVSPEKSANSEHEPPPEDQRRTDSKKQPRCVATPEPQRPSTWSDPLSERHNKSETARVPGNVPNKTVSDSRPSYTYLTSNPDRPANGWRGQHSVPRPQTAQKGPEPVRPSGLEPLRERAGARTVNPADEHQQHKEGGRGVHDASAKSVTRSLGLESDGSDAAPAGARSSSLTRLMRACDRGMLSEDEHDERSERRLRAGSSKRRRTRKDTLEQHAYARHDGLVDEQDDPLDLLVYAQPGASDSSRLRNAPHPYRSRLQDRFTTPPPDTYDSPPRRNAFDHTFDDPISPDPLELVDFGHGASHRTREVAQVAQRAEEDDSHDLCDCEECQHVHGWQDGGGEPEWSARAAAKYTEYTERGEEVEQAPYGGGLPSVPYPVHDPVGHGRERMCDDPDGHEPCRWPVSESVWAEAHTEEAANALFTNPVYRRNGNKGSGGEDKAAFVERLVRMDGAKADTNSWDWNEARFGAHGEERFWRPFRR